MPFLPPRVDGTIIVKDEPPLPTVIPPTIIQPFVNCRHTGTAVEQHVEQTVVHETHVGKQILHERHIDKPVIHDRHIQKPTIHEKHIVKPVFHEIAPVIVDHQYTTAAPIVMNEYGQLPAQITVEHSVAPPILAGSTLTAHVAIVSGSPTALMAPRSPTWLGPRSPSSPSSCSSYSPVASRSPIVFGGCQEVIVVDKPPTKADKPAKAEKGLRLSLKQRLDQKLHRHQ